MTLEIGTKYYYENENQLLVLGELVEDKGMREGRHVYIFNNGVLKRSEIDISDHDLQYVKPLTKDIREFDKVKICELALNRDVEVINEIKNREKFNMLQKQEQNAFGNFKNSEEKRYAMSQAILALNRAKRTAHNKREKVETLSGKDKDNAEKEAKVAEDKVKELEKAKTELSKVGGKKTRRRRKKRTTQRKRKF
jgi:hypothetical protein